MVENIKKCAYSILHNPGYRVKSGGLYSKCITCMNKYLLIPNSSVILQARFSSSPLRGEKPEAQTSWKYQWSPAGKGKNGFWDTGHLTPGPMLFTLCPIASSVPGSWGGRVDPGQYTLQIPWFSIPERLVSSYTCIKTIQIVYFSE